MWKNAGEMKNELKTLPDIFAPEKGFPKRKVYSFPPHHFFRGYVSFGEGYTQTQNTFSIFETPNLQWHSLSFTSVSQGSQIHNSGHALARYRTMINCIKLYANYQDL